jgi:hypothetical protein
MPTLHIEYNENVEPFMNAIYSICEMHLKKSFDYGSGDNPYHNIEASEDMGIPAWVGITLRMNDKEVRIKNFLKRGNLANESVRDSIHDNAVYGILRLMEYDRAVGVEAQTTQAVYKDHNFDRQGVCVACGWNQPDAPEPEEYIPEWHHWYNDQCDRCGVQRQVYDHWVQYYPSAVLKGQLCEDKHKKDVPEDLKPFFAQHHLFHRGDTCARCGLTWPVYIAAIKEKRIYPGVYCEIDQRSTLAACKDHKFDSNEVCLVCGWYEISPGMGQRAEALRYNSMGDAHDD